MTSARPKKGAPESGWVVADLARITGTSVRAIRYYVELGLIRYLERRGTATRYPRATLIRLLALPTMQFELKASLAELKQRMDRLGEPGLEAWVRARPLQPAAQAALGIEPARVAGTGAVVVGAGASVGASPGAGAGASAGAVEGERARIAERATETWQRVRLLPGLELMLSAEASPLARLAAERIQREFFG